MNRLGCRVQASTTLRDQSSEGCHTPHRMPCAVSCRVMIKWIALLLTAFACASGCVKDPIAKGSPGRAGTADPTLIDPNWPYWPVRMRVHPLSRIMVAPSGMVSVEARLEFFDQDDITCRASGHVRLEVHDDTGPVLVNGERSWNIRLDDARQNRQRYDVVVRTYLFLLDTDWQSVPTNATLHAWYLGSDGMQITDRRALRGDPAAP